MTKSTRALLAVRVRAVLAAAAVLLSICALGPPAAHAATPRSLKDKKKVPTTGRIEISTDPAGYPIFIDGQEVGKTTDYVRAIELDPGTHTVEIQFPNATRWSQVFNIIAGRKNCIALNYRPRTIEVPAIPVSPCPYPVNVTAPLAVGVGDIVTFTADVGYAGPSALNYTWTVSPPAARILSGASTPTVTVDSSGLAGRRLTAKLVVDDGSGKGTCVQTVQASTAVNALQTPTPPKRPDGAPSDALDEDKSPPAAPADPTPSQSGGRVQTVDLSDVTGTVCDCGEGTAITPEGSGMGKKVKKPKKP